MQGHYFWEYLSEPNVAKPEKEIFSDLDRFTWEVPHGEVPETMSSHILLPPLRYKGHFLKGLILCTQADYLIETWPKVRDLFIVLANSQSCSYPWSRHADALCCLYPNPAREAAFRESAPDRAHQELVPIQDADWTHEYWMNRPGAANRDLDILCVARLTENKNLGLIARALRIYHECYGPIKMTLTGTPRMPWDQLIGTAKGIFEEMVDILDGDLERYLNLTDYLGFEALVEAYARHKVFLLGALIEGKNRALVEALCGDTPVVCFAGYNQYARAGTPLLPTRSGELSAFDPESLAHCLHQVVSHSEDYAPRAQNLAGFGGRQRALDCCLRHLRYFRDHLPFYHSDRPSQSLWLDLAAQETYGLSAWELMYSKDFYGWSFISQRGQHPTMIREYGAKVP